MIYQVKANILFDNGDEARDFYHDCQLALAKGTIINPGEVNMEISTIEQIANNHEEDPNQPCEVITQADNL